MNPDKRGPKDIHGVTLTRERKVPEVYLKKRLKAKLTPVAKR